MQVTKTRIYTGAAVEVSPEIAMKSLAICAALLATIVAAAQSPNATETGNESAAGLGKQVANPLSDLWLMQFQQNNNWIGMPGKRGDQVQSNLQFQPLMPVRLTGDWNLVTRPVMQLFNSMRYLDRTGQSRRTTGFGDMVFAFALSPGHDLVGSWLLAAGPTFIFPTATESMLGQHKWQFGPTVAVGYLGKSFIAFVFPQQWFSIGGSGRKTSQMSMQYGFVYFFSNGWSLGTNPDMLVDWEAPRNERVVFPSGLQVGKLSKIGSLPVKFDLQGQYYAVHPENYGSKWGVQLQVTPVIPSLIKGKIF